MSKQLKNTTRSQIFLFYAEGNSLRATAKKFNVSASTAWRTIKKYETNKSFDHKRGNGRPTKLSNDVLEYIKNQNLKNPKNSLRKIQNGVTKDLHKQISHMTIKRALNKMNKYAFSPIKKPVLSLKHIKTRFECSKTWIKMNSNDVKRIIFSDESKFNLFYSDGKVSVWREPGSGLKPQHLSGTVKHGGGSVMVWGCFSYQGVGRLVFIDGVMDAARYCSILSENLLSSASEMGLSEFIFQQDNDPKHTSKLAKEFIRENNLVCMTWPAQSPDMNPIENLWGIIKEKVAVLKPKNLNELKISIQKIWKETDKKLLEKLALGFKERAVELYRAKGWHTKH